MSGIEIKSTVKIEDRRVADLLCCAFEGGVDYWCTITDYIEPPLPAVSAWGEDEIYKHIDYPLSGGAVICRETETEGASDLRLDRAALERGLYLLANEAPRHWHDFVNENEDAATGDVFVQLCLLGEIVYG